MPASPTRTATLLSNLTNVRTRIAAAAAAAAAASTTREKRSNPPRLVAVSKLKPASDILALHSSSPRNPHPHTHFGENYLQELQEKARVLPPSIKWHFIGGLQSNKCVSLARDTRALWAVESVDSARKAALLNKGWEARKRGLDGSGEERLRVYVQVNTSGEASKAGVAPGEEVVGLCRFVREHCPALRLQGLMTIGAIARSKATATPGNENADFVCLREARERVVRRLGLEAEAELELELSMGMSGDFEGAIALGSDQVRVGTTIFGDRLPKDQAKIV
ncbi:hypothetical protein ARAM_005417 [Aspergillus rambellii]|uniref:Pyridoxal phosphate homeostasis protein n=1 Tax=Aspergillus rambellii TaxID=308745 RepID=A0A0F8WQ05_9EURO|nr:hypothetical protein ARAM_005417 [Aspergillus rambellii]